MPFAYTGEVCALLSALVWSVALILFRLSGLRVPPISLNLFKNTIALGLFALTLTVVGGGWKEFATFAWRDIAILAISGMLGIALADTVLFYALNRLGVGLLAVVECLYSPFVILFAALLLGDTLQPVQYFGAGMIVLAVLTCSRHAPPDACTRGQLIGGLLLGAAAMALMAGGIVMAKPVLNRPFPLFWAASIRLFAGTALLFVLAGISPARRTYWGVFRPSRVWWVSIPGAILGTYVAMLFWVAGFKYAQSAVAGILNQTASVFALMLATLVLKEPFTRRKVFAVAFAFSGVLLVMFGNRLFS